MVKKRIIPCLLLKNGRMVKGKQFKDYRDTGNPVSAAKVYNAQSADELIFIDIEASKEGRTALKSVIEKASEEVFMPFCVGGGINSIEIISELLLAGADKVSICTAAVENPDFIRKAVAVFGSQCIVVCIDYKLVDGVAKVFTHCGTKCTDWEVMNYVEHIMKYEPGELLVHCIERDGMQTGYDLETLTAINKMVNVPVIAMGGVGSLDDFKNAFEIADVSAVSAASIFHFTDQSPIKANFYLKSKGIRLR